MRRAAGTYERSRNKKYPVRTTGKAPVSMAGMDRARTEPAKSPASEQAASQASREPSRIPATRRILLPGDVVHAVARH